MDKLGRTCDKNHDHQVCEGQVRHAGKWVNRTRLAQVYPRQFCQVVCECIVQQNDEGNKGTPQGVRFLPLKLLENMRGNIMFGKAFDGPTRT